MPSDDRSAHATRQRRVPPVIAGSGWRLGAVWALLILPFLYGAAAQDAVELGFGGGQYTMCGGMTRYSQAVARVRYGLGDTVSAHADAGFGSEVSKYRLAAEPIPGDSPPAVDSQPTQAKTGSAFLRLQAHADTQWAGIGVGALGFVWGDRRFLGPVYRARLGPRWLALLTDYGTGGFGGGLYEGNLPPYLVANFKNAGYGVQLDTRYWGDAAARRDGAEVRLTTRHQLKTFEVAGRLHSKGILYFVEVTYRSEGVLEASVMGGIGWELGASQTRRP